MPVPDRPALADCCAVAAAVVLQRVTASAAAAMLSKPTDRLKDFEPFPSDYYILDGTVRVAR